MGCRPKGLKADLHIHTCDGAEEKYIKYNAFNLIDAAVERRLDVLSITNHNTVTYNNYLSDYARERGILLIPGVELTLKNKHVLIYNLIDELNGINNFDDLKKIKDKNNLFIAPHPFFPANCSLGKYLVKWQSLFDAIELSHFYTRSIDFNKKAIAIAEKFHLPMVGTSDSHLLRQLNTTYSVIYAEKNIETVIDAVKNGEIEIVTHPLSTAEAGMVFYELFFEHRARKVGTACFSLFSLLWRS